MSTPDTLDRIIAEMRSVYSDRGNAVIQLEKWRDLYADAARLSQSQLAELTTLRAELEAERRRVLDAPIAYARSWKMDLTDELNGPAGTWKLAGKHFPHIVGKRVRLVLEEGGDA